MSHGRHDYPTAIHLLRVQGRAGDPIFFPPKSLREDAEDSREHASDLQFWESLVARACDRCGAKVHGYTWLPNEAILLLQRFAVPLRIILPSLVGQYSRHLHETGRVPLRESPYLRRCESIEVTPELLPYALRNLYARTVKAGLCESPSKYPFCSHDLHFAESAPHWFETREFLARVRKRGYVGRASVEQFLAKPEGQRHAELFDQLSARSAPIAGEVADIDDSLQLATHSPPAPTVKQVAAAVATLLRRESLSPDGVLAAALTTWYATRTAAATLAQMGHWFHREPTTLRAGIESHRKSRAALFALSLEEFEALIRAHASATAASRGTAGPDVDGVATMPSPASSTGVSQTPPASRPPNAPRYGVPILRNAHTPVAGGPARPRTSSEFASACISNEDTVCLGPHCDPDLTVIGPRRTRKRR